MSLLQNCSVCKEDFGSDGIPSDNLQKKMRIFYGLFGAEKGCCKCFQNYVKLRKRHNKAPGRTGILQTGSILANAQTAFDNGNYGSYLKWMDAAQQRVDDFNNQISELIHKFKELVEFRNQAFSIVSSLERLADTHPEWSYQQRRRIADYSISDQELRKTVFSRDNWKCKRCEGTVELSIDHIKPVKLGGSNDISNLQTLCRPCNSRKGAYYVGQ